MLPRAGPAAFAAAGLVFALCWVLVHHWFWGGYQIVDTPTYQTYGEAMRHGRVPYRDFAVEYPPGALLVFLLPALVGASYAHAFAWLMALCGLLTVAVVATLSARAALVAALAPVLVGSLILSRFDLWPTLLAVGAVAALVRDRDRLGWGLLGAGVVAKLWPVVLVPLALAWTWRRRGGREAVVGAAIGAAVVVAVFAPFVAVAPHGVWASLSGQASRPLQIESLGAAFLVVLGDGRGVVTSHGSQNLVGPHAHLAAAVLPVLQVVSLVAIWIWFARARPTVAGLLRASAAAVCAFVAFGKVFSPQYLVWLVPLVPLVRGRRGLVASAFLVGALVLTQVWFPLRYWDYVALHRGLAAVVLARDLLVVALVVLLAVPQSGSTGTRTS